MDKINVIAQSLKIGRDMRAKQDGTPVIAEKILAEQIKNVVPCFDVESGRGFIL